MSFWTPHNQTIPLTLEAPLYLKAKHEKKIPAKLYNLEQAKQSEGEPVAADVLTKIPMSQKNLSTTCCSISLNIDRTSINRPEMKNHRNFGAPIQLVNLVGHQPRAHKTLRPQFQAICSNAMPSSNPTRKVEKEKRSNRSGLPNPLAAIRGVNFLISRGKKSSDKC